MTRNLSAKLQKNDYKSHERSASAVQRPEHTGLLTILRGS